jgi:hypothetical protein
MIRGTSLALALALTGGMLLSGVAQAASPLTARCVRSKSAALRVCQNNCRNAFKEARNGCYGPGASCAQKCVSGENGVGGFDGCMAPVTKETEDLNDACNKTQSEAIDACRSAFQEGLMTDDQQEQCANNARLQNLECKLAVTAQVDDKRLACSQEQAACLGACASCGLPSQCPP